jgi:hypothetical protein
MAANIRQTLLTILMGNMEASIHPIHPTIHTQQLRLELKITETCHSLLILMMRIKWE